MRFGGDKNPASPEDKKPDTNQVRLLYDTRNSTEQLFPLLKFATYLSEFALTVFEGNLCDPGQTRIRILPGPLAYDGQGASRMRQ